MIQWQDTSKPNEDTRFGCMMDDMRMSDEVRRRYASSLAASLNGLTLDQTEGRLEKLDDGYHAYSFTMTGSERNFRISKSGARGWDGVSFTVSEEGIVEQASVY